VCSRITEPAIEYNQAPKRIDSDMLKHYRAGAYNILYLSTIGFFKSCTVSLRTSFRDHECLPSFTVHHRGCLIYPQELLGPVDYLSLEVLGAISLFQSRLIHIGREDSERAPCRDESQAKILNRRSISKTPTTSHN
jgi:hypothetical protein